MTFFHISMVLIYKDLDIMEFDKLASAATSAIFRLQLQVTYNLQIHII